MISASVMVGCRREWSIILAIMGRETRMRGCGASVEAIFACMNGSIDCLVVGGAGWGKEWVEVGEEK